MAGKSLICGLGDRSARAFPAQAEGGTWDLLEGSKRQEQLTPHPDGIQPTAAMPSRTAGRSLRGQSLLLFLSPDGAGGGGVQAWISQISQPCHVVQAVPACPVPAACLGPNRLSPCTDRQSNVSNPEQKHRSVGSATHMLVLLLS